MYIDYKWNYGINYPVISNNLLTCYIMCGQLRKEYYI